MYTCIYLCSELASKWPMTEALSADVQSPYPFLTRTRSIGVPGATAIECFARKAIARHLVCRVSMCRCVDLSLFVQKRGAIRAGSRETHRNNHAAFAVTALLLAASICVRIRAVRRAKQTFALDFRRAGPSCEYG